MTKQISRRQALAALGSVSLGALLAACGDDGGGEAIEAAEVPTTEGATATVEPQTSTSASTSDLFADISTCNLTPEQTEGPYYFDVDSIRSDIREDREGTTLRLAVRVEAAGSCTPVENAVAEIWHCDALGLYSGFEAASTGAGGGGGGGPTDEETYLRGAQVTNADGIAEFLTIYPGWYIGRTVHVHAKVHLDSTTALTTQFYFDEAVTDAVYASEPYSQAGGRDTFNENDGIFDERLLLTLSEDGDGYVGLVSLGVEPV
jgi:protocatechuate 3,4-dioxygenase beta subunit